VYEATEYWWVVCGRKCPIPVWFDFSFSSEPEEGDSAVIKCVFQTEPIMMDGYYEENDDLLDFSVELDAEQNYKTVLQALQLTEDDLPPSALRKYFIWCGSFWPRYDTESTIDSHTT